ncbi:hypothetical protein MAPG_07795 [Magnaporthiopsis poae ATCC 64411]|uniref:Heterokaryon incompatibility domain-containing protein n=1 Tax=Magnaporthiopsis poae (strain ATCC 64411 / 73-15) TaxID=644358 RepID=A0A0C4E5M2_MAGP6|nr:hypothetical protein MAPG_07795 [Magnaporthiopsis poae ATCC 64411]
MAQLPRRPAPQQIIRHEPNCDKIGEDPFIDEDNAFARCDGCGEMFVYDVPAVDPAPPDSPVVAAPPLPSSPCQGQADLAYSCTTNNSDDIDDMPLSMLPTVDSKILCELWKRLGKTSLVSTIGMSAISACNTKCQACDIIQRVLRGGHSLSHKIVLKVNVRFLLHKQRFLLTIRHFESTFLLGPIQDTPNPWGLDGSIPSDTLSTADIRDRVGSWLRDCTRNHSRCRPDSDADPVLPTRVLKLGPGTVTLLNTDGSRGRYICLSYCWGKKGFIKTTPHNFDSHLRGISPDALPRTFQHAIEIARALGVQYLWIDALCIVQESPDDWERESSRMAETYRNSYLTLAVTWADSVDGGCFTARQSTKVEPVMVREILHFPNDATPDCQESLAFPLLTRAWAYQERMLAPRVLHIGREELLWECRECRSCECKSASHFINEVEKREFHDTITSNESGPWRRAPQMLYRQMITQYSALQMSHATDKLPALSGLAEEIKRARGGTYLAGLWKETMVADMCWYISDHRGPSTQVPWRAPSWSWASVDKQVEYDQPLYSWNPDDYKEHAVVKEAQCTPAGATSTGQVTGGFAKIECSLVPADNLELNWHPDGQHDIESDGQCFFIPMVTAGRTLNGLVVRFTDQGAKEVIRLGLAKIRKGTVPVGERMTVTIV